jgi:hypothetical protein
MTWHLSFRVTGDTSPYIDRHRQAENRDLPEKLWANCPSALDPFQTDGSSGAEKVNHWLW